MSPSLNSTLPSPLPPLGWLMILFLGGLGLEGQAAHQAAAAAEPPVTAQPSAMKPAQIMPPAVEDGTIHTSPKRKRGIVVDPSLARRASVNGNRERHQEEDPSLARPASVDAERRRDDWLKVLEPRPLIFPQDHGPHPDYRIEWWYYTGNLETETGRRFGYQLTFFRTGLRRWPENPSRWAVRDLYTAHLALADVTHRRFHRFERSGRAGVGWAGADGPAGRVWNGNWELKLSDERHLLTAEQGEFALQLTLDPGKGPVLQGDRGLSSKGAQPGNASFYYSFPRMPTRGTLTLEGKSHEVRGASWMDHEFSSSFLEPGQQGWDWFSIQLDNQHELMLYQIRGPQGRPDARSSGTWVRADGQTESLRGDEFQLIPDARWKSPATGADYPQRWRVRIPRLGAELTVQSTFPQQEMDTRASTGIVYWEGSIDVTGKVGDQPATGRGYLEMTGYSDRPLGGLLE